MPIERTNSFHLLLSDDELKLLKLLAERDGLNASDYLRTLIRTMPSTSSPMATASVAARALGGRPDLATLFEAYAEAIKPADAQSDKAKKKKAK
jgi:hypothetical protein